MADPVAEVMGVAQVGMAASSHMHHHHRQSPALHHLRLVQHPLASQPSPAITLLPPRQNLVLPVHQQDQASFQMLRPLLLDPLLLQLLQPDHTPLLHLLQKLLLILIQQDLAHQSACQQCSGP